jgi:hypothetical protein
MGDKTRREAAMKGFMEMAGYLERYGILSRKRVTRPELGQQSLETIMNQHAKRIR